MSPNLDRHVVTAVLVAHDGARWLPETLKALLTQTRPVQRFVAVDTSSRDRGPAVLTEVVGTGNLLRLPRSTGYGEAVAEALRHPAASIAVPGDEPGAKRTEWIWLLHDDSAPAHDALALLLRIADGDPNAVVLGPKLRDWNDRRLLLEMGVTIDGAGRRETGVEHAEFDQGQHDGVRDVLAVSTAGMLVRRDVWDQLGGLDTTFGLFRDDVDFGWRAHAAGHRVVAVSDAVVYHAEASRRGAREIGMSAERARRRDRRNALYTLLANLPPAAMLRALARNVFGSLLRTLFLLTVKQPEIARDELGALGDVLRHPLRLRRARRARASGRKRVYRSIRRFQPRRVALRRLVDTVAGVLAEGSARRQRRTDEAEALTIDEPGVIRRLLAHPGVLVVLGLTAVTLVAERSLVTVGGRLGGGALVPALGGASDLWTQYVSGWHPVGLGSGDQSPPYIGFLALLSTAAFGKPWVAVSVLLLGSVPLAGLTAYLASRPLVVEPAPTGRRARNARARRIPVTVVRAWLAATYALLPVATGAIAEGRLGTAVVFVLLPLIGMLVARMFGLPRNPVSRSGRPVPGPAMRRKRAGRAAWGVALLLTVSMAFVPLTWLLGVIGGVLVRASLGNSRHDRNLIIALAVPPLLLLPWTATLLRHPSRFLLEAGLLPSSPGTTAASLLALNPGGPGTPPAWALGGLLLAAVLALPLRSRRLTVLGGWMLALFGLLTAIGVSAITVTKGADRAPVWPGVALAFAAAGILLAATAAVQRASEVLAGKDLIYKTGGAVVVLAAVTAPLLAALSWIGEGAGGPLGRVPADTVPSFVSAPTGPRTLVMATERDGRVAYTILRGAEPALGQAELEATEPARRRMDALVAGLAGSRSNGDPQALARMGVQYVLVPRPAGDRLTAVLDSAPELTRLSRTDAFGAWRLLSPAGRLMLVDNKGITPLPAGRTAAAVDIPAGQGTRTLLLAEPSGGWQAALNGSGVRGRTVDGWAQGYDIPASGGKFTLSRGMLMRHIWLGIQAVAVLVVAVLALPGAQAESLSAPSRARARGQRARVALARRAGGLSRRLQPDLPPTELESVGTKPADPPEAAGAPDSDSPVVSGERQ